MNREAVNKNRVSCALILVLPLLLFCLSSLLKSYHGPYYLGYNYDPEYAYLLNSLNLLNGQPPQHTDHPGTTAQILGAAAIAGRWLSSGASGSRLALNEYVLRHPEECLRTINLLFNALVFGALVFTSYCIYHRTRQLVHVLIYQGSLCIPFQIKLALTRVSPEPLLVFTVILLSGVLMLYQERRQLTGECRGMAAIVGVILGFGIVTKVTFLPLLLFILMLRAKERVTALLWFFFAALMFLLPAHKNLPQMFNWFSSIAIHNGTYGKGAVGVPAGAALWANFLSLVQGEPFLFVFFVILVLVLAVSWAWKGNPVFGERDMRVGVGVIFLQYLITSKHPDVHYMVPAIALLGLLNVRVFQWWQQEPNLPGRRFALGFFIFLLLGGVLHGAAATRSWAVASERYGRDELRQLKETADLEHSLRITHFRGTSLEYALAFGNSFAGRRYAKDLAAIYPDAVFYNIWSKEFYSYTGRITEGRLNELLKAHCVVQTGKPLNEAERQKLDLKAVRADSMVAYYRLLGVRP